MLGVFLLHIKLLNLKSGLNKMAIYYAVGYMNGKKHYFTTRGMSLSSKSTKYFGSKKIALNAVTYFKKKYNKVFKTRIISRPAKGVKTIGQKKAILKSRQIIQTQIRPATMFGMKTMDLYMYGGIAIGVGLIIYKLKNR